MQFLSFVLQDFATGAAIPFGQCTVYLTGTGTTAALFNASGGSISNPVIGGSNAVIGFAAANGTYDFQFANADGSLNGPKKLSNQLFDLSAIVSPSAATRAALAALPYSANAESYLVETGREGPFIFSTANLSASVTGDPQQGVYVAPAAASTGASGAWVRTDNVIRPSHFGAVGDGSTNDLASLQAFNDWFFASERPQTADFSGQYSINGTLNIGPSSSPSGQPRYNVRGNFQVTQSGTGVFETIKFQGYFGRTTWHGGISVTGSNLTAFASLTNVVGITFYGTQGCRFTGRLFAKGFSYAGVYAYSDAIIFDDEMVLGTVNCTNCGSGSSLAGLSLTAGWSAPVRTGVSRSTGQRDQITVTALPSAAIETYKAVGSQAIFVNINSNWYYCYSWDRIGSTISIYPWLSAADYSGGAGSGTLRYAFGGAVVTAGGDSLIQIEHLYSILCGVGLNVGNLYGPRVDQLDLEDNGIGTVLGSSPASACLGTTLDGLYLEANDCDILFNGPVGTSGAHYINSTYAPTLSKVLAINALDTATDQRTNDGLGLSGNSNVALAYNGYLHWYHDSPVYNLASTVATFRDHARPPRRFVQNLNSQTVTLTVQDASYNRLWGYRGGTWCYVGTGANGAPTGIFTFVPPTGGTINGGAVNANATFSGFSGPAEFEIFFTDTAQLTWVIRQVVQFASVAGLSALVRSANTAGAPAAVVGAEGQTLCVKAGVLGFNPRVLAKFDHFVDVGNATTAETDLYTDSIGAGQLAINGDKLEAAYSGVTIASATATREFRVYFGGSVIFDSTALTINSAASWEVSAKLIRVSATVVRYSVILHINGITTEVYTKVGELTGLVLSNANTLKITGQAAATGAASNDIVAKLGSVGFVPAA